MPRNRRHPVVVERLTEGAPDAFGEVSRTYASLGTFWARVTPMSLQEGRLIAEQVNAEATHLFEFGWSAELAAITASDRLTHDSTVFDVLGVVDPDGRDRTLEITAKERNA